LQIICRSWLQIAILLPVSASWVAGITGVNYWHLACSTFWLLQIISAKNMMSKYL
jgi:hypothetical protein